MISEEVFNGSLANCLPENRRRKFAEREKEYPVCFFKLGRMIAGGGLFGTLMNGFGNKYQYQVKKFRFILQQSARSF